MVNLGVSGNLMSLGAVDFGLIIDGAVVIVENVVRQLGIRQHELGRRLNSDERREMVLAASKQVANPMFFGVVIITIVYIPILALTGIEGKMFHPMAMTVMLALTGALLLALTLMPVLCSFLLRGRMSEGDIFIFYKPIKEWPKNSGRPRNKAELHAQIGSVMKRLSPNSNIIFSQPIEERFDEMLEGTKAELSVKIFGDDYDVLDKLAEQIKGILEKAPGAGEIEFETEGRTRQLLIEAKHDELQRYSLSASEVNKAVSAALAGKVVGTAIDGEKRYEIVVRMPDQFRADEQKIRELPLRVGDHGLLKLGEVADLKTVEVVEPILRDEGRRRAALLVNLETRDVEGFVHNAEQRIKQEVKMPEGYIFEFGGAYKNLEQARARLMVVVPAALALIFILIFLAFGSIRQALLVYTGIPLAVTGGVLSLWLRGMPFSITAAIGFIALSGVAVLNGLVLISYFNQLREQGHGVREAVIEGSLTRLRPVLMTALVASLGFVPMAIATGTGAEVQRPLATVVIGGILSSTFLTLIVLPVLYAWFERDGEPANKRPKRAELKLEPALT